MTYLLDVNVLVALFDAAYPTVNTTPGEAAERLRIFCRQPGHEFWPDAASLTDATYFDLFQLQGHHGERTGCGETRRNQAGPATPVVEYLPDSGRGAGERTAAGRRVVSRPAASYVISVTRPARLVIASRSI